MTTLIIIAAALGAGYYCRNWIASKLTALVAKLKTPPTQPPKT